MKKTTIILASATVASFAFAESAIEQFNELGYGTLSGRLQTLSMYRDYDNGANAHATTLGIQLNYLSPELEGWTVGAAYNGAGVLDSMDYDTSSNPGEALVANGRNNVLNEGYLNYNMAAFGLTNTTATAGRRINNGEVFRADDFRQKARSITAIQAESKDVENFRIAGGHAFELSNWMASGDNWKFNDFGDVFGAGYNTAGITWGEGSYTGIENLEVALFDAIAYDVANLLGARAKYALSEETALLAYYRNERDVGKAADRTSNAFGLSVEQKAGAFILEGGYFGVHGGDLHFQETTTGINHALGSSMMIYAFQFDQGADTLYAKATTKLEKTNTTLYGLYNYTRLDKSKTHGSAGIALRQAQELNLVVKQPIPKIDNLTAALKVGLGYRDGVAGAGNTFGTDTRLFVTYTF